MQMQASKRACYDRLRAPGLSAHIFRSQLVAVDLVFILHFLCGLRKLCFADFDTFLLFLNLGWDSCISMSWFLASRLLLLLLKHAELTRAACGQPLVMMMHAAVSQRL